MLKVEILPDGGVIVSGNERELRVFASWILQAAVLGESEAAFVTDEALTSVRIQRTDQNT